MYLDDVDINESQTDIWESDDSPLEEETFDADAFFMEARHSLSLTSSENTSGAESLKSPRRSSLFSTEVGSDGLTEQEELNCGGDSKAARKQNKRTVPFQEFAVRYVNKYLVTDLLSKKNIVTWEQSCHANEMRALPNEVRTLLKVKNLKLGPLLRLMVIRSIHQIIERHRDKLPIDMKSSQKDEILASLMAKDFEDDKVWSNTLRCILEAGFVANTEISPFNPNRMSFDEKLSLLKDERLLYEVENLEKTFFCPKLVFNVSNLRQHNGYYRASNTRRHMFDELLIFDPMVKQKMNAKLRSYNDRKDGKVPKFTKLEFDQNINLNHPLIPHLRGLRNPRSKNHIAGEHNSCLLFNIDQHQTLEQEWVDTQNMPFTKIARERPSFAYSHAPEAHLRFRKHSSITGTYYLGYDQKLFCHDSYRQWAFKNIHFKRISAYMYVQELANSEATKLKENWPCMIYDLKILNLPFKAAGRDFIQTWLLAPQDESDEGFVNLPGLKEQYQAMVVEKMSQDEYIGSQFLKKDLEKPVDDSPYKIVLDFNF
ncbi:unnamed protein product [Kluyveromyces dobzhanskii CBS 2104]|uniref:WGS project CCBQ000000000 data, contig 00046 n=1 Tax=Kluyveromyces dobzhanskii CBS 2104 TaxID=1427455 RepID=A0A0A8L7D4_9SACH|nr:unnamed protein product [Kluyveromyces dobzhanskii CBS 2104]